jgi:ElaB/YqjD/DUF883 family membrane-anchored ribosome-binding protein
MIGEGEPLRSSDGTDKLERAKEAIHSAAETVKATTQTLSEAVDAGRQPGAPLDRLAHWTREAPLNAVAVAFLIGILIGRR